MCRKWLCSICFEAYSFMDSICGFGHLLCLYKVLSVVFLFQFFMKTCIFETNLDTLNICVLLLLINGKWDKWQVTRQKLKMQQHLLNFNKVISSFRVQRSKKKLMFGLFFPQNPNAICIFLKNSYSCLQSFLNCKGKGKEVYFRKKE